MQDTRNWNMAHMTLISALYYILLLVAKESVQTFDAKSFFLFTFLRYIILNKPSSESLTV
jgi:hypothetical protein